MRRYPWLVGAVVWLAACAPRVDIAKEREALLAADRSWSETTGDMDRFMSFFAPDASVYVPGLPVVTGTEAIRQAATEMFSTPGFALAWTATGAGVSRSGDLGYTKGTYESSAHDPAGNPVLEKGKFVTVWQKDTADEWKVVEDIFNADAPPPAPVATPAAASPPAGA